MGSIYKSGLLRSPDQAPRRRRKSHHLEKTRSSSEFFRALENSSEFSSRRKPIFDFRHSKNRFDSTRLRVRSKIDSSKSKISIFDRKIRHRSAKKSTYVDFSIVDRNSSFTFRFRPKIEFLAHFGQKIARGSTKNLTLIFEKSNFRNFRKI